MSTDLNRPGQPVRDFADDLDRAYPADIFPAPTAAEWRAIRDLDPNLAGRIYSAAARRVAAAARCYADEIEEEN